MSPVCKFKGCMKHNGRCLGCNTIVEREGKSTSVCLKGLVSDWNGKWITNVCLKNEPVGRCVKERKVEI